MPRRRFSQIQDAESNGGMNGAAPAPALAKRLGLNYVARDTLKIRRRRCGKGWSYLNASGRIIRDPKIVRRLARLAVPPAYEDVLYAADPRAHICRRSGAMPPGRLQYRYHPDWEKVRETRKARASPVWRRCCRASAAASVSIFPAASRRGSSRWPRSSNWSAAAPSVPAARNMLRQRGTRGAATLLKSNVPVEGERSRCASAPKAASWSRRKSRARGLRARSKCFAALPGARLFQYRDENGEVHARARARGQRVSCARSPAQPFR